MRVALSAGRTELSDTGRTPDNYRRRAFTPLGLSTPGRVRTGGSGRSGPEWYGVPRRAMKRLRNISRVGERTRAVRRPGLALRVRGPCCKRPHPGPQCIGASWGGEARRGSAIIASNAWIDLGGAHDMSPTIGSGVSTMGRGCAWDRHAPQAPASTSSAKDLSITRKDTSPARWLRPWSRRDHEQLGNIRTGVGTADSPGALGDLVAPPRRGRESAVHADRAGVRGGVVGLVAAGGGRRAVLEEVTDRQHRGVGRQRHADAEEVARIGT